MTGVESLENMTGDNITGVNLTDDNLATITDA